MTPPESLRNLLESVANGRIAPDLALKTLQSFSVRSVGDFAQIDSHRSLRTGFPEAVYGAGKTPEQIARIMAAMGDTSGTSGAVMATRVEREAYLQIQQQLPEVRYYPVARICALPCVPEAKTGKMGVLCAGTSDLPVAEEAAVTAELWGFQVLRFWDVGVAGIHRLLDRREAIAAADVLVVVAGMEGALPSVVAGLAEVPVVAVPTSVGYGANFQGLAPLLAMLNSCAPGIGVVNIDNGFGAAVLAGQILRTGDRLAAKNGLPQENQ